jgi:polyphosphate kinase
MEPGSVVERPRTGSTLTTLPAAPQTVSQQVAEAQLYFNRELSWLAFDERVLDEAVDSSLPLFERLKFLSISASNLDEFFMVRVAGLKQKVSNNIVDTSFDGRTPTEQLVAIAERVHALYERQYTIWDRELRPGLADKGLLLLSYGELSAEQKNAARAHFRQSVFPALTPLAVDPGHPFPHLRNKSLNVAVLLQAERSRKQAKSRENHLAVVQVPAVLPRLVKLPAEKGLVFILLEEVIAAHVGELFPGFQMKQAAAFRVTRNSDLLVDDEDTEDLLSTVQQELRRRDRGAAVRLELGAEASIDLERVLTDALNLVNRDVYRVRGPLHLPDLTSLTDTDVRPELRVEPLSPATPVVLKNATSLFDLVSRQDVLLHHPYESFDPVVRFMEEAAEDANVLAIKQTLYRTGTGGDSPFVRALSRAAENGKQVTVLVEIKARFDEANNIAWARRLEENGVHVVYGLIGLKTHCKVALVVRREQNGIRRYVHLGTGNYNQVTARQYTDLSLMTARESIADDASALFNMLTGYSEQPQWKRLVVAPLGLQERVLQLIAREAERAAAGEPARIQAKLNSLEDPVVIRALYLASQAGVHIDLLVRGICCLRPGVPGVSEHIRVTSVVDRFLEHSRIYVFGTGQRTEVYLASADWMRRNFQHRIEVMFPIEEAALRSRVLDVILATGLRDNVKSRMLQPDGSYAAIDAGETPVRSQVVLMEEARKQAESAAPIVRQVGL